MKGVVIISGGMDSVTLAYDYRNEGHDLILLSVDYGQRHGKELEFAREAAAALDSEWALVDLQSLPPLMPGSSLVDPEVDVPHGHYAAESMKATVVPNRNAILLSLATGVAVAREGQFVATAVHAGDHAIYPDCRPEFITAFHRMARIANEGFALPGFSILAPYVNLTKADIVLRGDRVGVPYDRTWSCYEGGLYHCGECGTCTERKEAFALAGVTDPTEYSI